MDDGAQSLAADRCRRLHRSGSTRQAEVSRAGICFKLDWNMDGPEPLIDTDKNKVSLYKCIINAYTLLTHI